MTPNPANISDNIIQSKMFDFLSNSNIITDQTIHGFIYWNCDFLNVNNQTEYNKVITIILTGISKAFDTISHEVFIKYARSIMSCLQQRINEIVETIAMEKKVVFRRSKFVFQQISHSSVVHDVNQKCLKNFNIFVKASN